jgi:trimethylamine monooxygenase
MCAMSSRAAWKFPAPKRNVWQMPPREAAEDTMEDSYGAIAYQGTHVQELIDLTDHPCIDIPRLNAAFSAWTKHKARTITALRDNAFGSVTTATLAPLHRTPRKDALQDSMESSACGIDAAPPAPRRGAAIGDQAGTGRARRP